MSVRLGRTASAGLLTTSHCKPLLFWFPCKQRYITGFWPCLTESCEDPVWLTTLHGHSNIVKSVEFMHGSDNSSNVPGRQKHSLV